MKGLHINKRVLVLIAAAGIVLLVIVSVIDIGKRAKFKTVLKQYQEMVSISSELYVDGKQIEEIEKRIALADKQSLPVLIESVVSEMGLKEKLSSVKPFGGGELAEYSLQESEVQLENLTLNELVNVMYGIYTAPAGFFVTSAEIKKDFSEPKRLDVRMTLKLVALRAEKKS